MIRNRVDLTMGIRGKGGWGVKAALGVTNGDGDDNNKL